MLKYLCIREGVKYKEEGISFVILVSLSLVHLSVSVCLTLYVCLSLCLFSAFLSPYLSVSMSTCLRVSLSHSILLFFYLCLHGLMLKYLCIREGVKNKVEGIIILFVRLSDSVCLSVCLSICLFVLSASIYLCLHVFLSTCLSLSILLLVSLCLHGFMLKYLCIRRRVKK